jgi:hypothetical protein
MWCYNKSGPKWPKNVVKCDTRVKGDFNTKEQQILNKVIKIVELDNAQMMQKWQTYVAKPAPVVTFVILQWWQQPETQKVPFNIHESLTKLIDQGKKIQVSNCFYSLLCLQK